MNKNNQITTTKVSARERKLKGEKRIMKTTEMTGMAGMNNNMTATAEDRGDIRESMARMDLRNPQHKRDRDAYYEMVYGLQAGVEDLRVLELWSEGVVDEAYLLDAFLATQLMSLMKAVGPAATNAFNERIPDRAVEVYRDSSGNKLLGLQVTLAGTMKLVRPSVATLGEQKAYINWVWAPLAAIHIMEMTDRLMREENLSPEKYEVCRDVMGILKAQFGSYLAKKDEFVALVKDSNAAYEKEVSSPVTLKETDIQKSLDGLMGNLTNLIMDPLPREALWEKLTKLFETLGPNATERMETMFPDAAIEEFDLPGIYFQNDNWTVSFVEQPKLQDKKNYLNYVLAPIVAMKVMNSLKAWPQVQKDRMTAEERESYRTLMLTLRRGFADYLNPAATYVDELESWRKRGGKINKAKVMSV